MADTRGVFIGDPWERIPTPSYWVVGSETERLLGVTKCLEWEDADVKVIRVTDDATVVLELQQELTAKDRGTFLLDIEAALKRDVDEAITVYLQPKGDRNALRRLRGIEVKNV